METKALLQALNSLGASNSAQETLRLDELIWLGTTPSGVDGFSDPFGLLSTGQNDLAGPTNGPLSAIGPAGSKLPATDKLLEHLLLRSSLAGEQWIRATWLVAVRNQPGQTDSKRPSRVALPLLRTQIELDKPSTFPIPSSVSWPLPFSTSWKLRQVTDWNLGVNIEDELAADHLLSSVHEETKPAEEQGSPHSQATAAIHHWIHLLAEAVGWELDQITEAHPASIKPVDDRVTVCIGLGLIGPSPTSSSSPRAALGRWANVEGIDGTAFNSLTFPYNAELDGSVEPGTHTNRPSLASIVGPIPLSAAQQSISLSAAIEPITTVSGAPGTGKTHTLCAAICSAIGSGQSVLVATRSIEAAEVIAAQLGKQPGPPPLRFGSPDALKEAITELDRRLAAPAVDSHAMNLGPATQLAEGLETRALELLTTVEGIETYLSDPAIIDRFQAEFPILLAQTTDLGKYKKWVEAAAVVEGSWWDQRRRRAAIRRLRRRLASSLDPTNEFGFERSLCSIREAIATGEALRAKPDLSEIGEELRRILPQWFKAITSVRLLRGEQLDQELLDRARSRSGRQVVSALSTALRSGAAARGKLIDTLHPQELLQAAPLWLGTLGEVERLLPKIAGLFDLVVIDEASQVELDAAAPGLLRAKRALIAGDPQQLRFVSFLSTTATHQAFEEVDLLEHVARLDPARNSVFDLAASAAPVHWLDEHYRSAPHLIRFSAENFYANPIHLVTQSPQNLTLDCIHTHFVSDNLSAINEAIERTRSLHGEGARSIGIISPFRDMIDQLTQAALEGLSQELLADTNLMISTTHGFQGAERSHILIVVGIDHDSPGGRSRFLENPNLFNVLVTRARNEIDVFATEGSPPSTLLGRYLRWAQTPPSAEQSTSKPSNSTADTFGQACRFGGITVTNSFPVGRHVVDLVLQQNGRVTGVLCGTHPDGATAHLDRYAMLRQAGWDLIDLIPPDDSEQLVKLAAELTSRA